jgi:hypothetical protein
MWASLCCPSGQAGSNIELISAGRWNKAGKISSHAASGSRMDIVPRSLRKKATAFPPIVRERTFGRAPQ